MVISELINKLEELKKEYGDLFVAVNDDGEIFDLAEPWLMAMHKKPADKWGEYEEVRPGSYTEEELTKIGEIFPAIWLSPYTKH